MNIHTLYQHIDNKDVAFAPTHVEEWDEGIHVSGIWFNVVSGRPYRMLPDNLFIKKEDIFKWKKWHLASVIPIHPSKG